VASRPNRLVIGPVLFGPPVIELRANDVCLQQVSIVGRDAHNERRHLPGRSVLANACVFSGGARNAQSRPILAIVRDAFRGGPALRAAGRLVGAALMANNPRWAEVSADANQERASHAGREQRIDNPHGCLTELGRSTTPALTKYAYAALLRRALRAGGIFDDRSAEPERGD
jgi:hypothetical protein